MCIRDRARARGVGRSPLLLRLLLHRASVAARRLRPHRAARLAQGAPLSASRVARGRLIVDPERWSELSPLLDRALELSGAERDSWIGEIRARSPALAAELTSLLSGESAADKLLNLALLSPSGQERFRREGSVLARLTHSGIARLLDAGVSPAGQPY